MLLTRRDLIVGLPIAAALLPQLAFAASAISVDELLEKLRHALPGEPADSLLVLLDHGVDAVGAPYAVVGVGQNHGWDWNVVLFANVNQTWKTIAGLTFHGQKAHVPVARYVPGAIPALMIEHLGTYGTGVFLRLATWYRVAAEECTSLIHYPLYFYVFDRGMPFNRKFEAHVQKAPKILRDGEELNLTFKIDYYAAHQRDQVGGFHLFADVGEVSLIWGDATGMFQPKTAADALSHLDTLWDEATDGWLARSDVALRQLLTAGTEQQRNFARAMLSGAAA